jgi:hypothetical protein
LFLSSPQDVVKLADDKWQDHIPKRPADNDDSDKEENVEHLVIQAEDKVADDEEVQVRAPVITSTSNDGSEQEELLSSGFSIDDYHNIVRPTQELVTDSQLSTMQVFDPDETQIPGSLD